MVPAAVVAVIVVAFTTTTLVAAFAPIVTAVATACSVPEIVSNMARPVKTTSTALKAWRGKEAQIRNTGPSLVPGISFYWMVRQGQRQQAEQKAMIMIHDEPNEAAITELYAYLSKDETGEGICAVAVGAVWTPLVTSKARVAESMRPLARQFAEASGKSVRLVRFSNPEEISHE